MRQPDGGRVLAEAHSRLRGGFYARGAHNAELQRAIFQNWNESIDMVDAYCFSQVRTLLLGGMLAMTAFDVGAEPLRDSAREENERALRRKLPRGVQAFVNRANCTEGDGTVEWSTPITFTRSHFSPENGVEHLSRVIFPRGSAVLEIGTTASTRTLSHLQQVTALARWPYGSRFVTVFARVNSTAWDELWRQIDTV